MLSLFQILSLIIYVAIAVAAYLSYATAHRPFVSATLRRNRQSPDHIDLVVKNYGSFAAREIKLTFSSPPKSSISDIDPEHQISNWHFIKEDINVLFPGEERLAEIYQTYNNQHKDGKNQRELYSSCASIVSVDITL